MRIEPVAVVRSNENGISPDRGLFVGLIDWRFLGHDLLDLMASSSTRVLARRGVLP